MLGRTESGGSPRAPRGTPRCSSVMSRTGRSSMMSFFRRQGRSTVRLRLEQLERRDVPAVLTPTTFANAGISFNTATRTVEGGLYNLTVQESNQPISTVARYVG